MLLNPSDQPSIRDTHLLYCLLTVQPTPLNLIYNGRRVQIILVFVAGGMIWALGCGQTLLAAPPFVVTDTALWSYAETLFKQGEYYRAITEYKRLIHFFPQSQRLWTARLRIAEAYLLGGEAEQALQFLEDKVWEQHAADPSYTKAKQNQLANARRLLLGLGWLEHQKWLPYPKRKQSIEKAVGELNRVDQHSAWGENSKALAAAIQQIEKRLTPQFKSPTLGGTLSALLPGLGSAYLERYSEAVLAAVFTLGLAAGANHAFQRDKDGTGTLLGIGALAFYGGGIYLGISGAHKHNARLYVQDLHAQRKRFGFTLRRQGWLASWDLLSP